MQSDQLNSGLSGAPSNRYLHKIGDAKRCLCAEQDLSENMGLRSLNARLQDPDYAQWFGNIFPRDTPRNMRFSINFFTSIGLGGLTDALRAHLAELPKLLAAQREAAAAAAAARGGGCFLPCTQRYCSQQFQCLGFCHDITQNSAEDLLVEYYGCGAALQWMSPVRPTHAWRAHMPVGPSASTFW